MDGPFDTDVLDEADAAEDSADEAEDYAFDEGDQGDGFSDEMAAAADAGDSLAFEGDAASDLGEEFGSGDDMAVWNAFEQRNLFFNALTKNADLFSQAGGRGGLSMCSGEHRNIVPPG